MRCFWTRDNRIQSSLLADHPAHHVERAYRKAYWVTRWRKACSTPSFQSRDREGADNRRPTDRDLAAAVVAEARNIEGTDFRISVRSLHAWHRASSPILFSGKPKIYERLGFRELGEFSEVTDQLASRIVMSRDLTARTRGDNPQPLYTIEDIRNLIKATGLKLHVSPDAQERLQAQACTLGLGGIGKALLTIYLAAKLAYAEGEAEITVEHLEDVVELTIGHEDANRVSEVVADSSGMRRVV